jgi:hypothetical protein
MSFKITLGNRHHDITVVFKPVEEFGRAQAVK